MKLQGDRGVYVSDAEIAKELELDMDEVRGHLDIIGDQGRAHVICDSSGHGAFLRPGQRQAVKEAQMAAPASGGQEPDPTKVFVVHGRNQAARDALFVFLRAIHLHPMEWSELVAETHAASPYTGEVLHAGFQRARAIVVALTPDDVACLREPFRNPDDGPDENTLTPQPRPNVLIEAGMALGHDASRTVLVQFGKVREVSDLAGRNVIRMADTPEKRKQLAQRLGTAGCAVDMGGDDWMRAGDFGAALALCSGPSGSAPSAVSAGAERQPRESSEGAGRLSRGRPQEPQSDALMKKLASQFSEFVRRFKIQWTTEKESAEFIDGDLKRIIKDARARTTDFAARLPGVLPEPSPDADNLLREALTILRKLEMLPFPGIRTAQEQQVWRPGADVIARLERVDSIIKAQLHEDGNSAHKGAGGGAT